MPPVKTSRRQKQLEKTRELRRKRMFRREDMLEDVVCGVERVLIATKNHVSLKTVYREINKALDQRSLETPERHLRVQIERLMRAVQCIDYAMFNGKVESVELLLKVMERLDFYQGLHHRPTLKASRTAPQEPPLSLTHKRTENTSQGIEIAESENVLGAGHETAAAVLPELVPGIHADP